MGGKFHGNLFFHFVFLLFSVFRHYVATAIITHGYKYHSLPLLVDLQIFSVSTPFQTQSYVKPQYIKLIKEHFVSVVFVRFQCMMLTYKTKKKEQ